MRGVTKLLLAAALALLLTTGLAACGGDDGDDSTAGSVATTTEQTAPATTTEDDGSSGQEKEGPQKEKEGKSGSGEGGGDSSPSTGGSDEPGSPASPGGGSSAGGDDPPGGGKPASGSGGSKSTSRSGGSGSSAESEGFGKPGGDQTIQDFGKEAGAAERAAASRVVVGFMSARAASDWTAVCTYLSASTLKPLEGFASRAKQLEGKGCPELLEALVGTGPASTRKSTLSGGIDSFRVKAAQGFALYHGTDGTDYYLPMVKEGQWKVGALAPTAFPG